MPLKQLRKPQSAAQIESQKKRKQTRSADTQSPAMSENSAAPGYKQSLEAKLRDFFADYDQRYYRINQMYPIGHMERPETMKIHQKSAIEKILGMMRG